MLLLCTYVVCTTISSVLMNEIAPLRQVIITRRMMSCSFDQDVRTGLFKGRRLGAFVRCITSHISGYASTLNNDDLSKSSSMIRSIRGPHRQHAPPLGPFGHLSRNWRETTRNFQNDRATQTFGSRLWCSDLKICQRYQDGGWRGMSGALAAPKSGPVNLRVQFDRIGSNQSYSVPS